MTIADILDKIRELSTSSADMGRQFEKLVNYFLYNSPLYSNQIKEVWLWNDFPYRGSATDSGIDLVAKTETGEYWAIQCKFYQEGSQISKPDIDSFISAASTLKDESGKKKYSKRLVVATVEPTSTARDTMNQQDIPSTFLHINEFDNAGVDWDKFWEQFTAGGDVSNVQQEKFSLREHQQRAFDDVIKGFQTADRGKLIMACGTGKTFTSLKIAEEMASPGGLVLYAVPSLALLGQTLSEWSIHSQRILRPILVCSDTSINEQDKRKKKATEDESEIQPSDLALPATTSAKDIVEQYQKFAQKSDNGYIVVFSTYQSLDAVKKAQKKGLPEFDLIVCDEAHRTTGISIDDGGEEESYFLLPHDNKNIKAKKRLYMTATPRIYGTRAKEKAKNEGCDVICSMDDENIYGKDFHELSFGEAVKQDLLTDYKVIIITVSERKYAEFLQFEKFDPEDYKKQFPRLKRANDEDVKELMISDLAKMFGCWQGLAKRSHYLGVDGKLTNDFASDPAPMRTAVAFASTIKVSKNIVAPWFKDLSNNIEQWQTRQRESNPNFDEPTLHLQVRHVDGTIVANARAEEIKWLKTGILPKHSEDADQSNGADQPPAAPDPNACRILTNVRCLSEGVDVPALDAVIFLSPRNSKVDIVQSVGRVMRKAPGKKYGYVILPIAIPDGVDPEKVLDNTDRFKVVWDVLQTLRSHDDRLRIEINKLRFKDDDPPAPGPFDGNGGPGDDDGGDVLPIPPADSPIIIAGGFSQLNENIRARVVKRCGDRDYLEESAKEIALIAQQHVEQIKTQLQNPTPQQKKAFDEFLEKLQQDLNPSIDQAETIEMISQHIIMQPVFDALFADYSFAKKNVVSQAFENLLDVFKEESSQEEWAKLEKVRKSIRDRVDGITSWRHKQTVITSLYDKFFKIAAEKTAERLGIVYTPVEVVDFIIHSVEHILQTEFKKSMNNRNVHILDPFTGTGTFIVQLLQSGIIKPDGANFAYKFNNELHANEIVLLAYYIASINIESTFHAVGKRKKYSPFPGLALTDTFQMGEKDMPENAEVNSTIEDAELENVENDERILRQRRSTIEVILGNPPYSVGQTSANDNNQNQKYPKLDKRVEETYVAQTAATNKNKVYDSYIKAFRWASDRIGEKGVIGFVTNGGWLDGNSQDGLRKCFAKEFTSIYVFNLRGNARTSGELRQKEAGNVFGGGTRTPVIITILVKNPEKVGMNCQIFYYDIGDYLKREDKLQLIKDFHDVSRLPFQFILPNQHGDWINQRGEDFQEFMILGAKGSDAKLPNNENSFFASTYSLGLASGRDAWVYNFSEKAVKDNMRRMVSFYNQQVVGFAKYLKNHPQATVEEFIDNDPTKISWNRNQKEDLMQLKALPYNANAVTQSLYRPFIKQELYFNRDFNAMVYQLPKIFPTAKTENLVICVSGLGSMKDFSCLISNSIPCLDTLEKTQCFPLYYYTPEGEGDSSLFGSEGCEVVDGYVRHDGITDAILARAKELYNVKSITKKDLFYYVYGFLHSPEYRQKYAADLKKSLARIPLVKSYEHFLAFADAGEKLALLHLNYDEPGKLKNAIKQINKNVTNKFESVPVKRTVQNPNGADDADLYRVEKMRFPKKNGEDDKSRIAYNERITLENIPLDAYEYVVNGKSAIEWIMDRYQVKTDPASQIVNDPNLWNDGKTPKYIVELLESVVTVSVNTMRIVNSLPKEWEA